MFDYLLFEKYGLDTKETNVSIIKQALENKKNADGWQQDLKQINERKRKKAEENKKQWEKDCEILLDTSKRQSYLDEFEDNVMVLIEGVNEEGEEYIETFAFSVGIDVDTAKKLYERYSTTSFGKDSVDTSKVTQLVMQISDMQKEYLKVQDLLNENETHVLLEKGISTESIGTVLDVDNCDSLNDILNSVSKVCDIVYELYNKQLLSPEFQKRFMEIFSKESKNEYALNKLFAEPDFVKYFKINNWILFKYIKATQLMMNRKSIKASTRFPGVAEHDILSFMKALNAVFGVEIPKTQEPKVVEETKPKISTKELDLGMKLLEAGKFEEAKKHLLLHTEIDPYEWKSYWGLFKCELKAQKDNEIFFPGFLEEVRQSDLGLAAPTYVEYYKTARTKAYIVRATEINFDNIEIEYRRADVAQERYDSKYNAVKHAYEYKKYDEIPSEEGKLAAMEYARVCFKYNWVAEKTETKKYGIRFFILAIGLFILSLLLPFLGVGELFSPEKLDEMLHYIDANVWLQNIMIFIVLLAVILIVVGAIMIIVNIVPVFKVIAVIAAISLIVNNIEVFQPPVIIAIGFGSLLIGCLYVVRNIYLSKREEKLLQEKDRLFQETGNAMIMDASLAAQSPENAYYHVKVIQKHIFDTYRYDYDLD